MKLLYFSMAIAILLCSKKTLAQKGNLATMPPIAADFTYSINGLSVSFTDISNYASCAHIPTWNFGDPASGTSNTSAIANPVHVFSTAGSYSVCLTASGGSICQWAPGTKCSVITVTTTTGVDPICANYAFSVYPNPSASSDMHIAYTLPNEADVFVEVFNVFGEKVTDITNSRQAAGRHQLPLDCKSAEMSPGIYFVRLTINNIAPLTIKYIKE